MIWADGAITDQWLKVSRTAAATGRQEFYFGNAIGESARRPARPSSIRPTKLALARTRTFSRSRHDELCVRLQPRRVRQRDRSDPRPQQFDDRRPVVCTANAAGFVLALDRPGRRIRVAVGWRWQVMLPSMRPSFDRRVGDAWADAAFAVATLHPAFAAPLSGMLAPHGTSRPLAPPFINRPATIGIAAGGGVAVELLALQRTPFVRHATATDRSAWPRLISPNPASGTIVRMKMAT